MTPAEREAVAELLDALDSSYITTEETVPTSALRYRVRALLAAPVTEPASVAELREAIDDALDATCDYYCATMHTPDFRPVAAARARVYAIVDRLDAAGPVARGEADEDALREAAERFLVDDANGVTETAGLVAALADTAGAAQERAAADARAVERIRSRAEVEGDHCYPGQPAREAAWADRALESEARQAERDAVALTNAEEERTRMDRHALVLAYEWLRSSSGRFTRESYKKYLEGDSAFRVEMAMDALALGHSFCDGLRDVLTDRRGYVLRPARRTRARLALAIRAILRADRGDCGRARCSGCRCVTRNNAAIVRGWCSCCEERAEWRRDRITPLWERAGRTA